MTFSVSSAPQESRKEILDALLKWYDSEDTHGRLIVFSDEQCKTAAMKLHGLPVGLQGRRLAGRVPASHC